MRKLNLTDLEKSDIKYEIAKFPDGQQDIRILDSQSLGYGEWVEIRSRFNSFKDLELIVCATNALKRTGVEDINLFIPYLLGARSDRQFIVGGTSYLVDVVAPILNAQEYTAVTVMDAHSDVAAACIKNLRTINNQMVVDLMLEDLNKMKREFILISPDAGALKKIYKVADKLEYKDEIIVCSKHRDTEGKLTKCVVPLTFDQLKSEKAFVIIDDICDGGRTFINIATEIKNERQSAKIYLVVTHGIFSKGVAELAEYFDRIYTTNSIKDQTRPAFETNKEQELIKQLDIF